MGPAILEWFVGGKLNVAYNCLDRHVECRAAATGSPITGKASRATAEPSRYADLLD